MLASEGTVSTMNSKILKKITPLVVILSLLTGLTATGQSENEVVTSKPVRLLQIGDCVKEKTYGVRPDVFLGYQNCCEQRDLLQVRIEEVINTKSEGIITRSVAGDIWVAALSGIAITLLAERFLRGQ